MIVKLVYNVVYDGIELFTADLQPYRPDVAALYEEFVDDGKIVKFETPITNIDTLTRTNVITYVNQSAWDEYNARLQALEAMGSLLNPGYSDCNTYLEYEDGSRVTM